MSFQHGSADSPVVEADYLVLGSGLAGLYFALRASQHGRVVVVSKRALTGRQHPPGSGRSGRSAGGR